MINENQEIKQIEMSMAEAKKAVELREALLRLEKNRDFKKVFLEHYLKEFATNLVMMRGGMAFRANDLIMESNTRKLDSIGEFSEFCRNIHANGSQMELLLQEGQQTIDEIHAED